MGGIDGQGSAGACGGLKNLIVIQREILTFVCPQEYRTRIGIGNVLAAFDHFFKTKLDDGGGHLPHQSMPFDVLIDDQNFPLAVKVLNDQ